jgi:hypothetical protein
MKATEARLLEFLRKSPQFIIPIYQRSYVVIQLSARGLPNGWLPADRFVDCAVPIGDRHARA